MPKVKRDIKAIKLIEKEDKGKEKAPEIREALTIEDLNIQWPGTIVIVAKKFSGKSNLIITIVESAEPFDNVFVITGTAHLNRLTRLVKSEDFILDNISDEFIRRLIEHHEENPDETTLLIFDDILGMTNSIRNVKLMEKLGASGRNFNISMLISVQKLMALTPTIRLNTEYFFFGNNFQVEIEKIAKAFGSLVLPTKEIMSIMSKLVRKNDHEFLFWNDREQKYEIFKGELFF